MVNGGFEVFIKCERHALMTSKSTFLAPGSRYLIPAKVIMDEVDVLLHPLKSAPRRRLRPQGTGIQVCS